MGNTAPTITKDIQAEEKKVAILLDPAHIILVILLIAALLTGVYFFESKRADVAEAKAAVATQVAETAKAAALSSNIQNAAAQEQAKQVEAAYAAANAQLMVANQQLQRANTALTTKLLAQQKTDATLPPSGQAQRWQQLVPTATVTVTPSGFAIDPVGGLATIQALEKVNVSDQEIANFKTEVANDAKELANAQLSLDAEKAAHASDNANYQKQLTASSDNGKMILAEYNAYKAKARRNYLKSFGVGFLLGFITAHATGF